MSRSNSNNNNMPLQLADVSKHTPKEQQEQMDRPWVILVRVSGQAWWRGQRVVRMEVSDVSSRQVVEVVESANRRYRRYFVRPAKDDVSV